MDFVSLLIGLIIGAVIGYLLVKTKQPKPGLGPDDINLNYVAKERFADVSDRNARLEREAETKSQIINSLSTEVAVWQQKHQATETRLAEQKAELEVLQERFKNDFKVLAQDILDRNSKIFKEQNSDQINTILSPFKEKLQSFEKKVEETYEKGQKETVSLKTEVTQLMKLNEKLSQDASNLTKALKGDVKMQGNWGEVILESILERSGLTKNQEYFIQESYTTEDGKRYQPDVVVKLPDNKNVIVDAKVSLVAYERYSSAENADEQAKFLKEHILSIKNHIRGLSDRNYQNLYGLEGLDFVLLFVPIEGAFTAAIQTDNALFQEAFDRNVVVVSTSTLLATLRTINSIWKHEKQTQNALEIARQGADLYDKFQSFTEDMIKLGNQMDTAKKSYADAMNKLSQGRGNLIARTENMRKLGLQTTKQLDQKLLNRATGSEE